MLSKPNFIVPLAYSWDTRGVSPFSNVALDQRKVNGYFEVIDNFQTGSKHSYFAKRPGCSLALSSLNGVTSQTVYSIGPHPDPTTIQNKTGLVLGIRDSSNNIKTIQSDGVTSSTSATILNSGTHYPAFQTTGNFGSGFFYVVLQIGSDGTTPLNQFYHSTNGLTWTNITDGDFVALGQSAYGKAEIMDGFIFVLRSYGIIQHSDLNSPGSWSASSVITKTIHQDLPVGLARFKNQILAFGSESVEVFYNAGNATGSVLARLPHLTAQVGLKNPVYTNYYCTINEKMYFIGNEGGAPGKAASLFSYDGSRFEKIFHPIMNKIFTEQPIYGVYSVPFNGKTAVAVKLSAPTETGDQVWFMYFPEINEWVEWQSKVFTPMNNGRYFTGYSNAVNSTANKVFEFDGSEQWTDEHTTNTFSDYTYYVQFKIPFVDGLPHKIPYCGVTGNTARSATSLTISKSVDDAQTFTNVGTIDMTKARKCKYGLGMYQSSPSIRLNYTGPNDVRLDTFYATID